ncbi:MAG: hypothetical protein IPP85_17525 [Propionivibrio sp.]|nr:hypothetical protein [Propionivibrio sp.]
MTARSPPSSTPVPWWPIQRGKTFTINPTTFTNGVDLDPGPGVNIAGTLRATAGTLAVTPTNWSNIGAIESTGGTLTITGTNLSNTGTLSVGAGSILNLGGSLTAANLGTFSRTAGSTVNLTGILDLSSGTWTSVVPVSLAAEA